MYFLIEFRRRRIVESGGKMNDVLSYLEKMGEALLSFNWFSDLFDVILVTFVVYEAIKLVRGSRSFQVIKGIVFLIALFVIVKLFNMEASEFLLTKLFENALLILVVLFAPELRKILEKFGRRSIANIPLFNFKNDGELQKETEKMINDFCKAAGDLSETKTGALVVFEREAPLGEIISSGTVLDACSSAELFNGLFFKNSALHDGAVVVRNARIYAAGCILPLTQNQLSSELGTRHRAATGMSESSDAVVVVVSEETGGISVATGGTLMRDIRTGELREILLSSLMKQSSGEQKKFRLPKIRKKKGKGDNNED